MFNKLFNKIFGRSITCQNILDEINLTDDIRVIDMSERDFNSTISELSREDIKAGDTVTLTAPDGTRLVFIIRKNKKIYDK